MNFVLLIALAAPCSNEIVIEKIVDQKVPRLVERGDELVEDGTYFTRRFVLTSEGVYVKLGNDRHYMILTEHGYAGLGPSDNVVDIKNEGKYGMQLYYTRTMKQGLPGYIMYWQEEGKNQRDLRLITKLPPALKKAFLEGPKKKPKK